MQGEVSLVAFPIFHKRIKKAIIKRKDEDLGFKFELSEKSKYAVLEFKAVGNTITISLIYYPIYNSLGAY